MGTNLYDFNLEHEIIDTSSKHMFFSIDSTPDNDSQLRKENQKSNNVTVAIALSLTLSIGFQAQNHSENMLDEKMVCISDSVVPPIGNRTENIARKVTSNALNANILPANETIANKSQNKNEVEGMGPVSVPKEIIELDKKISQTYNSTFAFFAAVFLIGLIISIGNMKVPKIVGVTGVVMGVAGLLGFGLDYKRFERSK